ncbi:MAG: hemerythrin domain-containing protein [Promethearchaeota archaeon]
MSDYISKDITYSPPMEILIDEHNLMIRWLALIPKFIESINLNADEDKQTLLDNFNFISNFIDKLHLTKEEDEIFQYFEDDYCILKIIHDEHEKIRFYMKIFLIAIEEKDKKAIAESLYGYRSLLTDHIKNENEIIYPWIDRNLSNFQLKELHAKFTEINSSYHDTFINFKEFVKEMEEKLEN